MSYPLTYKEKLPKEINNSYKELTPNDTVITIAELQQYATYTDAASGTPLLANDSGGLLTSAVEAHFLTSDMKVVTGIIPKDLSIFNFTNPATALTLKAASGYGIQFVELMRKYGVGVSGHRLGTGSALSATQGVPTDLYPSLTAAAGSGILLFAIPKDRYGAGIVPGTFGLSGSVRPAGINMWNRYTLSTSLTSSIYGENVEIFPNVIFKKGTVAIPPDLDGAATALDNSTVSGFLFNDEGLLGIVSSAPNDANGYNPLSAYAACWQNYQSVTTLSNAENVTVSSTVSFKSQIIQNTMNFACKVNPGELNFSLNPSAFTTTAEGGSASYGYNYIYRLPLSLTSDISEFEMGDANITYGGDGSTVASETLLATPSVGEFQAYVTAIGMYNDNNELLAIGKLAQPIKKSNTIPMSFKISIDL